VAVPSAKVRVGNDRHLADVFERLSAGGVVPPAAVEAAVSHHAVLAALVPTVGLTWVPVGIRQRRVGRAPHPRALPRSIGAANPHTIASRSGDQQRVLRCGVHACQLEARRLTGGVGSGP